MHRITVWRITYDTWDWRTWQPCWVSTKKTMKMGHRILTWTIWHSRSVMGVAGTCNYRQNIRTTSIRIMTWCNGMHVPSSIDTTPSRTSTTLLVCTIMILSVSIWAKSPSSRLQNCLLPTTIQNSSSTTSALYSSSFFTFGVAFPITHPMRIINPPTMPDFDNISPIVTYANAAPHRETLVIMSVSSDADTTFSDTVSRYRAMAVDINPVHSRHATMNGSVNHSTHW
mmetsp:Transcript_8999/g.24339  ORF Transcript_8999/g.24339 Transcript_8999/m.24339 type:complete len:227 (+) Transcript_8999:522-1202(+)